MGKAPNLHSLRERLKFLTSLQGLCCPQLKIIHMPKWHRLERPLLNPYTILHRLGLEGASEVTHSHMRKSRNDRGNDSPDHTDEVTKLGLDPSLRDCLSGHPYNFHDSEHSFKCACVPVVCVISTLNLLKLYFWQSSLPLLWVHKDAQVCLSIHHFWCVLMGITVALQLCAACMCLCFKTKGGVSTCGCWFCVCATAWCRRAVVIL